MATGKAQDKVKSLLGDLGKPTLRGVRKCPKCGTYNGTRGISCKNKFCDVVFKEKDKKKPHGTDAVKIITGSTVQVFSVRLRDRGPDYRGFVQLPLVQDQDGNPATDVNEEVIASAAMCYVENCQRSANHNDPTCPHIKAAIDCTKEAQPLTLKNSVLNSLQVSSEVKQAIWLLATETTGPLVQRITKNIMVVKCKPNAKQPLGILHFSFFESSRGKQNIHKFQCSCKTFKQRNVSGLEYKRCVHFYACMCAFNSDDKLLDEFSAYLDLGASVNSSLIEETPVSPEQLVTYYPNPGDIEIHELHTDTDNNTLEVVVAAEEALESPNKKRRKEDIAQVSTALLNLQQEGKPGKVVTPGKVVNKHHTPNVLSSSRKYTSLSQPVLSENETVSTFQQWLSSVTERINQTMHYQFDGNPDPLVFHAPQYFFDCLQQRISSGNKKKRLPNFTTAFVRKDALPLGTFTKYTWHITNIIHVKQIFDTAEMTLEITRSFVQNRDSTYDLYEVPKFDAELDKNQTPIRPSELKTFLKVGNTSPDQKDPTPFIIEWIPDILPKSHIGELRIKFEYGHHRNGYLEIRKQAVVSEPIRTDSTTLSSASEHIPFPIVNC